MNKSDLYNSFLFKGVDEKYIDNFLSSCEVIDLKKGEFLFHQNDTGDAMYIIDSGTLQVILDQEMLSSEANTDQIVETLNSGSLFGELCVFGRQKRSASIYALTISRVLKIEGEEFRARVYSKELDALLICYNIAKLLCDRLSATNIRLSCYL